jgi:hypothetical protein
MEPPPVNAELRLGSELVGALVLASAEPNEAQSTLTWSDK